MVWHLQGKTVSVPICPSKHTHARAWDQTRPSAVKSQQLKDWAKTRSDWVSERNGAGTTAATTTTTIFYLVVCLTTGLKPLPKRALHIVRSRASSFKWEYLLLSLRSSNSFLRLLPCLLVTSIPPCIFPSVTRCRSDLYSYTNLSTLSNKRPDFRKKKNSYWKWNFRHDFLYNFFRNISYSKNNSARCYHKYVYKQFF